jgi:broad specificity phosphatase PhoE
LITFVLLLFREGLHKNLTVEQAKALIAKEKGIPKDAVIDNAESSDDVLRRGYDFLNWVSKKLSDSSQVGDGEASQTGDMSSSSPAVDAVNSIGGIKVAAISHGGFIKYFLRSICGMDHFTDKIANGSATAVRVRVTDIDRKLFECSVAPDLCNFRMD